MPDLKILDLTQVTTPVSTYALPLATSGTTNAYITILDFQKLWVGQQDASNNLLINSAGVRFSEVTEPATPPTNTIQQFAFDKAGRTVLRFKTPNGLVFQLGRDQYIIARNATGGALTKGQAVYISGSQGNNRPRVALARADSESTMPVIGVLSEDINNNNDGIVMIQGYVEGLNTASFSEGDTLYVSQTTAGLLTTTKPPIPTNFPQVVGRVINSNATQGIILVITSAMRGNLEGTNFNTWQIGDDTAGAKTIEINNGFKQTLSFNPTAARTITVPDATGTIALLDVAQTFTNKTFDRSLNTLTNLAIANADIGAGAAIQLSKLENLTSARIIVGSVSNIPTAVDVTGDVTISNAGVTAIGALKVTNGMLAGSIDNGKLATNPLLRSNHTGTQAVTTIVQGSSFQRIRTNSGASANEYFTEKATISFIVDGGGSVITAGSKGFLVAEFDCFITGWTILGDVSGSCVVDVRKSTYAGFPSTATIAGSEIPTLTSAQKNQDLTLSTWTQTVTEGDVLEFVVTGVPATVTRVLVSLRVEKRG